MTSALSSTQSNECTTEYIISTVGPTDSLDPTAAVANPINEKPLTPFDIPAILNDIIANIACQHHVYALLRVSRNCFRIGVKELWAEPRFMRKKTFDFCRFILKQSHDNPTSTLFPYYEYVKLFRMKRIITEIDGEELISLYQCCPNVVEIMLRNTSKLTGDMFVQIAKATPKVTTLHMGGHFHKDFLSKHMITGLREWRLSNLEVDDPDDSASLMDYEWFTDDVISCILKDSPGMEELVLYNVTSMTDKGLEGLREHGKKLNIMQLWRTGPVINPDNAIDLIAGCSNIIDLDISSDFLVSDMALETLTQSLKGLRSIGFSVTQELTDESIEVLAKNLEKLEDIQIRGSVNITSKSLKALAKYRSKQLQDIVILHVPKIDDEGLIDLLEKCECLNGVEVSQLPNVTDISFQALAKHCASKMQRLSLTNVNIEVETLRTIIQNCKKLDLLEIRCISTQESELPLLDLKEHGRSIEVLAYEGKGFLSSEAWIAISEGCPKMYSLKLEGADISQIPIEKLAKVKHLHHMEQLDISVCDLIGEEKFIPWFIKFGPLFAEWCTSLTDVHLSVDHSNVKSGEEVWKKMWKDKEAGEQATLVSWPNIKFIA